MKNNIQDFLQTIHPANAIMLYLVQHFKLMEFSKNNNTFEENLENLEKITYFFICDLLDDARVIAKNLKKEKGFYLKLAEHFLREAIQNEKEREEKIKREK